MPIIYDPKKTRQEMADAAGVSLIAVSNFLQRNKCNYRADRTDYLIKTVGEYFAAHPDASDDDAAQRLKISVYQVNKYRRMAEEGKTEGGKKAASKRPLGLSVSDTDSEILRSILRIYLPGKRTFDCDLTFGRGGFYSDGLRAPGHCYDKFLFGAKGPKRYAVKPLDEAATLADGSFGSVVIDLPVNIHNGRPGANAFDSLNSMFNTYHEMITLASRLLKPGGIMVFKTVDFVLRNDDAAVYSGQWATDYAIDCALETGFDLTDKFILARRRSLVTSGSAKVRTGLKHGYFLVFTKL